MPDNSDGDGLRAELEQIKNTLQGGDEGDDDPEMIEAAGKQPAPSADTDQRETGGQQDAGDDMSEADGRQPPAEQTASPEQGTMGEDTSPSSGDMDEAGDDTDTAGETDGSSAGNRLTEGNTYPVRITDIASKGDGMLTYQGKTVIVPETEIDEVVRIKINTNSRNFAFGDVVERDIDDEPINSE